MKFNAVVDTSVRQLMPIVAARATLVFYPADMLLGRGGLQAGK